MTHQQYLAICQIVSDCIADAQSCGIIIPKENDKNIYTRACWALYWVHRARQVVPSTEIDELCVFFHQLLPDLKKMVQ
jgi:hypothetical protein